MRRSNGQRHQARRALKLARKEQRQIQLDAAHEYAGRTVIEHLAELGSGSERYLAGMAGGAARLIIDQARQLSA